MIPSQRLFLLLGGGAVLVAAGVVAPGLSYFGVAFDAVVLALAWLDGQLQRQAPLEASRHWPPSLAQGATATVEVALEPRGPRGRTLRVELYDTLHPALVSRPERLRLRLKPGSAYRWRYTVRPTWRGRHRVGSLTVRLLGPLGLVWRQSELLAAEEVQVYPQMRWGGRVGRLLALAHRHELGAITMDQRGAGGEVYALRPYTTGDSPSQIHWKASARRAELVSREQAWQRGAPLVLLLDCGRSMASRVDDRSKLDHALAACLALCRVAAGRGDAVTVLAFSDRIERRVTVRRGAAGLAQAYSRLFDLEARLVEPVFDLATDAVVKLGVPRATVVVFTSVSDLSSAELLRTSLVRLKRRFRTMLLNLEDPEIAALAQGCPQSMPEAYAKLASLEIQLANRDLLRLLKRGGVRAANAAANRLALVSIEGYLAGLGA